MSLKDILVHVDSSRHNAARLDVAIALARSHGAHLVGLYVKAEPDIPPFIRAQLSDAVLEAQAQAASDAAEVAAAAFGKATGEAGVSAEWRLSSDDLIGDLATHARYVDVAVVGQRDPDGYDIPGSGDMPDRLILSVGRPVLVVPYVGTYPEVGNHVLVTWDASRLATRAVNDALPFLIRAQKVTVLAVNPHRGGPEGHGDMPGADICLHLARHGVAAEAQHVVADDLDPGDVILARIADLGADLLVMGAYGHARWRELVLGGVTRHLLRHMTVPVLMSH